MPRGLDVIVNSSLLHECASEGSLLRPVAMVKDVSERAKDEHLLAG